LVKLPGNRAKDLFEGGVPVGDALPIVAINLTHGTGSEVGCFSVAQSDGEIKPAIAGASLFPTYSIEDPQLTKTLPLKQTIATSVDSLNHATEAATTNTRNPYSTLLAIEVARLVFKYLPVSMVEPENTRARYYLMYASAIATMSWSITLAHITHSMEHTLSALNPEVIHGEGLAALLPAVIKAIYPAVPEVLADLYYPIAPELEGVPGEAEYAAKKIEDWLFSVGCTKKLVLWDLTGRTYPE